MKHVVPMFDDDIDAWPQNLIISQYQTDVNIEELCILLLVQS